MHFVEREIFDIVDVDLLQNDDSSQEMCVTKRENEYGEKVAILFYQ